MNHKPDEHSRRLWRARYANATAFKSDVAGLVASLGNFKIITLEALNRERAKALAR